MIKGLALFITLVSLCFSDVEYATLKKISDGDTFTFFNSNKSSFKCRVYGIDTPEKFKSNKLLQDSMQCFVGKESIVSAGKKATIYAEQALEVGKKYKINISDKDRYGRFVCDIEVPGLLHDTYSKNIVADGYAIAFKKYIANDDKRAFIVLEKEAMSKNLGLWKNYKKLMKCMSKESY